jgi:hypothetical protein
MIAIVAGAVIGIVVLGIALRPPRRVIDRTDWSDQQFGHHSPALP